MSIKTTIFAAAAIAMTATAGAAETYFEQGRTLDRDDTLELGLVRAEGAGFVEIYDFHNGTQGELLGREAVNAGANTDVRVNVGLPRSQDVLAVINIDGEAVVAKQYDIN